jgi:hypothetical protein
MQVDEPSTLTKPAPYAAQGLLLAGRGVAAGFLGRSEAATQVGSVATMAAMMISLIPSFITRNTLFLGNPEGLILDTTDG